MNRADVVDAVAEEQRPAAEPVQVLYRLVDLLGVVADARALDAEALHVELAGVKRDRVGEALVLAVHDPQPEGVEPVRL